MYNTNLLQAGTGTVVTGRTMALRLTDIPVTVITWSTNKDRNTNIRDNDTTGTSTRSRIFDKPIVDGRLARRQSPRPT